MSRFAVGGDDKLEEIFADGVSQVSYSEVFRIIFGRIDPQQGGGDQGIPLNPFHSVVLTANGLFQLKKAVEEVLEQMISAGVFDRETVEAATKPQQVAAGQQEAPQQVGGGAPKSSNFDV